jgi:hypothetical protein
MVDACFRRLNNRMESDRSLETGAADCMANFFCPTPETNHLQVVL